MRFTWDPEKASSNLKKHRVSFEIAATIFEDPMVLSIWENTYRAEERWVSLGMAADHRTLIVVHTWRVDDIDGEIVRLISARRATAHERRQYEEGI